MESKESPKGKVDLAKALELSVSAARLGAPDIGGKLRERVINVIDKKPDRKLVYVADLLPKA